MKRTPKILLLLGLQSVVIGLAISIGWYHGIPADRQRLKSLKDSLEQGSYASRNDNTSVMASLLSIAETTDTNRASESTFSLLNLLLDQRIERGSGWLEFGHPSGSIWSGGDEQLRVLLRLAEYRKKHPFQDPDPRRASTVTTVLTEAEKCLSRRPGFTREEPDPIVIDH